MVVETAYNEASYGIGHIKELREALKQIKDVGEHKFEACPELERYLNAAGHTEEELAVMEDSVDSLNEASHLAAAETGNENLFEIDKLLMEAMENLWALL